MVEKIEQLSAWRCSNPLRTIQELQRSRCSGGLAQGCQMVYFQTKDPNLGKFRWALEWNRLVFSVVIWNILRPFGNLVAIWYISPRFGTLCQEKSGNPGLASAELWPRSYQALFHLQVQRAIFTSGFFESGPGTMDGMCFEETA
jgi:hypothetical protein